jgi:hypothetical protein
MAVADGKDKINRAAQSSSLFKFHRTGNECEKFLSISPFSNLAAESGFDFSSDEYPIRHTEKCGSI